MSANEASSQWRQKLGQSKGQRRGLKTSQVVMLAVAFFVSIAIGYAGFQQFSPAAAATTQASTFTVRRGTLASTISMTGSVSAVSQANLAFGSDGKLTTLNVKVGDLVKKGDLLAQIETSDLELSVAQAEVSLEQAKLALSDLKAGPKEAKLAATKASYDSAVTKLNELKAKPKEADVAAAKVKVTDAEVAFANAKDNLVVTQKSSTVSAAVSDAQNEHNFYEIAYGKALERYNRKEISSYDLDLAWDKLMRAKEKLSTAEVTASKALRAAENDVKDAEQALAVAKTNLTDVLKGATEEELKSAEATMLSAKNTYEETVEGSSSTDIAAQDVQVRSAEATLKQKQLLLEKAKLVAPFDGVIDTIKFSVGEQVEASSTVITMVNLDKFRVEAKVGESNVAKLSQGQTANVTLDALAGQSLTAKVVSIGYIATNSSGVVSYPVILELDPTKAKVRPGMTATLVIEVSRSENALMVYGKAIKTAGKDRVVQVLVNGQPETRTVTTGISNDQYIEVKEGLNEGDVVVIPTTAKSATTTSAQNNRQNNQNANSAFNVIGGSSGQMAVPPSGGAPSGR
jgi:RND family efflux transporter MFP subunit